MQEWEGICSSLIEECGESGDGVNHCGNIARTLLGWNLAERRTGWVSKGNMDRREVAWLQGVLQPVLSALSLFPAPGKSEVERWSDMYTVTSQLLLKVGREDDGVPVICLVDHPAVKDLQTQRYLEVMCE